jgi:hypothetical protein
MLIGFQRLLVVFKGRVRFMQLKGRRGSVRGVRGGDPWKSAKPGLALNFLQSAELASGTGTNRLGQDMDGLGHALSTYARLELRLGSCEVICTISVLQDSLSGLDRYHVTRPILHAVCRGRKCSAKLISSPRASRCP